MPGNTVMINGAIEYYVGDSKMDELTDWLNRNGCLTGHGEPMFPMNYRAENRRRITHHIPPERPKLTKPTS